MSVVIPIGEGWQARALKAERERDDALRRLAALETLLRESHPHEHEGNGDPTGFLEGA